MKNILIIIFIFFISFGIAFTKSKCESGNCKNGKGILIDEDGTKTKGSFINGEVEGYAEVTFKNGDKFLGNYIKGRRHGKGKYIRANKEIAYNGEWINGGVCLKGNCKEGKGVIKYFGPDYHCEMTGGFKNSELTGKVSFFCNSNGEREEFTGEYKNGKPNGYGVNIFSNGSKYEGSLKDGNKHGKGTYTFSDGTYYKGDWVNDKENGNAIYTWKSNDTECKFEGVYKDGKRNGSGKYSCDNGESFIGYYKDDLFIGKGKLIYSDKSSYEGDFKDGLFDGIGISKDSEGNIMYKGEYRKGYKYFLVSSPDFINRSLKKPEKWIGGYLNKFIVSEIKYLDEIKIDSARCIDNDCNSAFDGLLEGKVYIKGIVKTTECCNLNIILIFDKEHEKVLDKLIENPSAFIEVSGRIIALDTGYEVERNDIIVRIEEIINTAKKK